MSFSAFLTLLFLGLISSLVLHNQARYRILTGLDGFLSKWVGGWIGGWLGSPVFGHWGMHVDSLYVIPALLGAFVGPFLVTAVLHALATTAKAALRPDSASQSGSASQFAMRKAS